MMGIFFVDALQGLQCTCRDDICGVLATLTVSLMTAKFSDAPCMILEPLTK